MLFLVLVVAFVGSTALVEAIELPKDDGVVVEPARVHMTKAINKTSGGRVTQVNVDKAELEVRFNKKLTRIIRQMNATLDRSTLIQDVSLG